MSGLRLGALDLSLTGTGIATWHNSDLRLSTVDGTRTTGHPRLAEILVAVSALRDADLIIIEDVWLGIKGTTALRLAELHGLVKHWLWLRCIPYVLVQPAQLKLYACGKGGGVDTGKDAVLLAVERRYGAHATVRDNNQADALILLAMGLDQYGTPLATVPAKHRAALAKVAWPELGPQIPVPGSTAAMKLLPDAGQPQQGILA
jgi:crossover junction endodeoxyribonuclease RuvC